jgi:hypothetical protein
MSTEELKMVSWSEVRLESASRLSDLSQHGSGCCSSDVKQTKPAQDVTFQWRLDMHHISIAVQIVFLLFM